MTESEKLIKRLRQRALDGDAECMAFAQALEQQQARIEELEAQVATKSAHTTVSIEYATALEQRIEELEAEASIRDEQINRKIKQLNATDERNAKLDGVLRSVACEFDEGSWQRRDIDAALQAEEQDDD